MKISKKVIEIKWRGVKQACLVRRMNTSKFMYKPHVVQYRVTVNKPLLWWCDAFTLIRPLVKAVVNTERQMHEFSKNAF